MLIGYARVSTEEQSLQSQIDALELSGCEEIFTEKISGRDAFRPELQKALDLARKGDCLVVWRLDRLGRSITHLIELVTGLQGQGIGFVSLCEQIDTGSATGKLMLHLFAALAEFERNLIAERTKAGLSAARARGRIGGRRRKLSPDQANLLKKLYAEEEHTVEKLCEMFKIKRPTLYRYLRRK